MLKEDVENGFIVLQLFHFRHFSFYFGVSLGSFLGRFTLSFPSFLHCSCPRCFLHLLFGWLLEDREEISVQSTHRKQSITSVAIF